MAENNPAQYFQLRTDHPANGDRLLISALLGRVGVGSVTDLIVTANGTPNMTVHVAAGSVFVLGTENALTQGTYHCFNDADVVLTVAASSPSNPRIDSVIARVKDQSYSGSVNAWNLEVVTGTPAASPVAPALPANCYELARLSVAANATSVAGGNITDQRLLALAVGAPGVYAEAAGQATVSGTAIAPAAPAIVAVTLPVGRFTQVPLIQLTMSNGPGGSANLVPRSINATTAGFSVYVYNAGAAAATWANLKVDWSATQMTAASAAG